MVTSLKKKIIRSFFYYEKLLLKKSGDKILLIPPTILNGSFGDELMVMSYIHHSKSKSIDLYTNFSLKREDLLSSYPNVNIVSEFRSIRWKYYSSIVVLGADNMTGSYGVKKISKKIKILEIANRLGIDTKIAGFSLKNEMPPMVVEKLRKISTSTLFCLRDIDTYQRAEKNKFVKIKQVADLAFLTPTDESTKINHDFLRWTSLQKEMNRIIIGFCPNAIHGADNERYVQNLLELLKNIDEFAEVSIVLMYHDLRKVGTDNDKTISAKLFNKLSQSGKTNFFYIKDIKNGIELKSYLRFVDMTITARMHFGISALSHGNPMLGIAYEDKFSGLLKLFNIEPEGNLITRCGEPHKQNEIALNFVNNINYYKQKIEGNLHKVKNLSLGNFQ